MIILIFSVIIFKSQSTQSSPSLPLLFPQYLEVLLKVVEACILPAVNVWSEGLVVIWFVGHDHGSDDGVSFRADVDHVEFGGVVFAVDGVL